MKSGCQGEKKKKSTLEVSRTTEREKKITQNCRTQVAAILCKLRVFSLCDRQSTVYKLQERVSEYWSSVLNLLKALLFDAFKG